MLNWWNTPLISFLFVCCVCAQIPKVITWINEQLPLNKQAWPAVRINEGRYNKGLWDKRKGKCRYPQDGPPRSKTFPAIGQSSYLLPAGKEADRERETEVRNKSKNMKVWLTEWKENHKSFCNYALLLVGQNKERVQNIVLWFPGTVPASAHTHTPKMSVYLVWRSTFYKRS